MKTKSVIPQQILLWAFQIVIVVILFAYCTGLFFRTVANEYRTVDGCDTHPGGDAVLIERIYHIGLSDIPKARGCDRI